MGYIGPLLPIPKLEQVKIVNNNEAHKSQYEHPISLKLGTFQCSYLAVEPLFS